MKKKPNPAGVYVSPSALDFITQKQAGAVSVGDVIVLDSGQLARVESIDTRTRKIRAVPIAGANAKGLDKAAKAFRAFTGNEPRELLEIHTDNRPRIAWLLGELLEVTYRTTRDGKAENYLHPFKKSARPLLAVDADTGQLALVGGNYSVTERGITDR